MDTLIPHQPATRRDGDDTARCLDVPEFRRLRYLYGQLLGAADFQAEQSYHRDKQRLHNRCLHGSGVICGLLLEPVPEPEHCDPEGLKEAREIRGRIAELEGRSEYAAELEELRRRCQGLPDPDCFPRPPTMLALTCGVALDCQGNELVVRRPIVFDPWQILTAHDRKRAGDDPVTLYVSLCYCEQVIDPVRPVLNDPCGAVSSCDFGRVRETVRVLVSLDKPPDDYICDPCCHGCEDCCLTLARIECFRSGHRLEPCDIHNEIRRRIVVPPAQPTVITGINWAHGELYSKAKGEAILGTYEDAGGIVVHFSRPVHRSSLRRGVVELWRLEGGGGRSGYITEIRGEFVLPDHDMVHSFRYRQIDEEDLDGGDRILIVVRCAFILDACCQPVDGAHVGGRVPMLPGTILPDDYDPPKDCVVPPWGYAPWTSGNGSPGSSFESWFTIAPHERRTGGQYRPRPGGTP